MRRLRSRWLRLALALAVVTGVGATATACEFTLNGVRWVCIADGNGPIVDANGNHWRCEKSWWQPGAPQ